MANEVKSKNPMVGTKIKATPKEKSEIGIDTDNNLVNNIIGEAVSGQVDISKLEGFTNVSQTRENIYRLIDTMADDPILASYLRTITEDAVETNDKGQIIWCESDDANCGKYVSFLLDSLNADKNAYKWVHSLVKYGDLYLKLFRESDYETDVLFDSDKIKEKEKLDETIQQKLDNISKEEKDKSSQLVESVNVVLHQKGDHYVNYVEMVPNPGEMFELTKFGKTMGFIHAPINIQSARQSDTSYTSFLQYRMKQKDVDVYGATDFVHASLEDNSSRIPEEVDIFLNDADFNKNEKAQSYTVKRGQSELASVFKIWRQLSLLENSAMLNRITKSSIIRMIQVEVGDMPKENIGAHLNSIKALMEQKTALNKDTGASEYTNPGPIENNIYIPTHNGKGAISATNVGGDFDPKQLTDISYFQDKLFGALGVPKAFFGVTDDGAGFNGGTSLAIQSSRYGKSIKRIQNTLCQCVTDLINLMLFDKGLTCYINKFIIRMQTPVTQEEIDRRESKKNKVGVINDIMMQLGDITNPIIKLKILKSLLADSIADSDIVSLIQEQIDELEKEKEEGEDVPKEKPSQSIPEMMPETQSISSEPEFTPEIEEEPLEQTEESPELDTEQSVEPEIPETNTETISEPPTDSYLPSFSEIGIDGTNNNEF